MKGDFSWLDYALDDNFTAVLEQQGRVRLDRDANAAAEIGRHLRTLMGRDTFGPGRVAIPAEASDSLRITAATTNGSEVMVTIEPGRAWIDGIPLVVGGDAPVTLKASYLPPPFQPPTSPDGIAAGIRDAVVLEVWEEAVNAYQNTDKLLEPALGGVDTSERVKVCYRLRLRRLGEDEDCRTIGPGLRDDPSTYGRLTVTSAASIAITGDCPVEAGGGYTGDGHHLYRVEIARPGADDSPRFVFSRFGGGLVGRGMFDSSANQVTITANQQMINAAGLESYHLQAFDHHPDTGCWVVVFEATATLIENGTLALTNIRASDTWPATPGETAFFRLWDGVRDIGDFTAETELTDGIMLAFEDILPGGANYRTGDYWTFPVRAAGVDFDPALWPTNAPPDGIRYHRAPLGELTWTASPPNSLTTPDDIEDCRDIFPPLTDARCCCTVTVGDGRTTHGDEDSIEAAISRLPMTGGRICLLPGIHETNSVIHERANIRIAGCGKLSRVVPRPGNREAPMFHVVDSEAISLADMDMVTLSGVAVLAQSSEEGLLRRLIIEDNSVLACQRAIQVEGGLATLIQNNRIRMLDKHGAGVAVFISGEDSRIERNDIGVVPAAATPRPPDDPDNPDTPDDPNDPCADPETIYGNIGFLVAFAEFALAFPLATIVPPPYQALGGIQIGAGAERITVLDNRIIGGSGNGITLGGYFEGASPDHEAPESRAELSLGVNDIVEGTVLTEDGERGATIVFRSPTGRTHSVSIDGAGEFRFSTNATNNEEGAYQVTSSNPQLQVIEIDVTGRRPNFEIGQILQVQFHVKEIDAQPDPAQGFLYDVRIEGNDIRTMGLNGIGIPPGTSVVGGASAASGPIPGPGPIDLAAGPAAGTAFENGMARFGNRLAAAPTPQMTELGNPIVGLVIRSNRITRCIRNAFTTAMRDAARSRGFAGISLGLCKAVAIEGNTIAENGLRHIDPVCGIYLELAVEAEINGNTIQDNGPFVSVEAPLEQGIRGAVVGTFLAAGIQGALDSNASGGSKPALRVHGNVARQPLGRALTATVAGPASVTDNYLTAERSGSGQSDGIGGAVLVQGAGTTQTLAGGGECLVNDNQIRLEQDSEAFIACAITGVDDLGFNANQVDALQAGDRANGVATMLNTLLSATTVRATGNRFREAHGDDQRDRQVSLSTSSIGMNVTALNEGDHCIFALDRATPSKLVDTPNLVLNEEACDGLQALIDSANTSPNIFGNPAGILVRPPPAPDPDDLAFLTELTQAMTNLAEFGRAELAKASAHMATAAGWTANEIARLDAKAALRPDVITENEGLMTTATANAIGLSAAADAMSVRIAPAGEDEFIVQGRVVDRNGQAVAGHQVALADSAGKAIRGAGTTQTDSLGTYVFRISGDAAAALKPKLEEGGTVLVATAPGKRPTQPSARFIVGEGITIAPATKLENLGTAPRPITPARRSPSDEQGVVQQRLVRPTLTSALRPLAASGSVSRLIVEARPNLNRPRSGEDKD